MLPNNFKSQSDNFIISTGNVLSVNKKTGQKATEELIDCINITLAEATFDEKTGLISRISDDLEDKITEHERNNIKIGAKVFLNQYSVEYLNEAVNSIFKILKVNCLDNLIMAYHPCGDEKSKSSTEIKEGVLEWGGKSTKNLEDLTRLWSALETFPKNEQIYNLGISDLDTETLSSLYRNCDTRPTIAQINLSACCIVPPSLQEFCNSHDIQLLTHSDPEVILKNDSLIQWGLNDYKPTWVIRYQVHVKCRGLLTAKGYIVGARK